MKRILRSLCCVLLAAAVFVSCDPGPAGIFSLLENEEPLNKGTTILNDKTASFVLRFNDYYYTAIGATLLRRPVAGGSWASVTVTGAPVAPDGEIYVISSAVTDSTETNLYVSYSPVAATILVYDGAAWTNYGSGSLPAEPVQSLLMASDNQLFAATQSSTGTSSSSYTTYYSIWDDDGSGNFTVEPNINGSTIASGCPASIAWDGSNYWITAGNKIFTGIAPGTLDEAGGVPTDYINSTEPVFSVYYDGVRVIAAGTGYLFNLSDSYARSSVFGSSARRLSSIVEVHSNEGGNAIVVGVKPWGSDDYLGYYEYDADLNTSFGSGVTPDTAYTMISTNSNYVTTLDDLGIEGFYYDSTGQVLFARTVMGGLWSNTWDGVDSWSGWDRE